MRPTSARLLNLLVPVKRYAHILWTNPILTHPRCVDYAVKVRVNPDQTGIDLGVKHSMVSRAHVDAHFTSHFFLQNPFDEIGP